MLLPVGRLIGVAKWKQGCQMEAKNLRRKWKTGRQSTKFVNPDAVVDFIFIKLFYT